MSLFKNFKMDDKKEKEGVEIKMDANTDGSIPTFRITRMGPTNQKYQKAIERETQPYKRLLQLGTLSNEKANQINMKVFVNSILQSWENVQDKNDKIIPYSAENALNLFVELPELFFELQNQASQASLFRIDEVETLAKN